MIRVEPFRPRSLKASVSTLRARFGLAMGAFVMVLVLLHQSPGAIRALKPLDIVTAGVTATVLEFSGMPVQQDGAVLSHPAGFSYEIYYNCTGLIAAVFLSIALLSIPGRWATKLMRVFVGAGLVFALNLVRLVSLFCIGVWYPQVFGFFHAVLWNAGMLVFVLGFWLWSFHRTRSLNTPRKLSVREPRPSLNRLVT